MHILTLATRIGLTFGCCCQFVSHAAGCFQSHDENAGPVSKAYKSTHVCRVEHLEQWLHGSGFSFGPLPKTNVREYFHELTEQEKHQIEVRHKPDVEAYERAAEMPPTIS